MIASLPVYVRSFEEGRRYAPQLRGATACLCLLVFACAVFAQRDLATLVGTVSDPSGGVVANAKVTITETGTGQVYTLLTSSTGDFVRPGAETIHLLRHRQRARIPDSRAEGHPAEGR